MPIDPAAIDREIRAGLSNERQALDCAMANREFYDGDFSRQPYRQADIGWGRQRFTRTVPLMRRAIEVLSGSLYRKPPTRTLEIEGASDTAANDWLAAVYQANGLDSLWPEVDRLTCVGGTVALQAEGTDDESMPVKVRVWDRSRCVIWPDPDDAMTPGAVATIDRYDGRRRLRLWTDSQVSTYTTEKWGPWMTAGGTAYRLQDQAENPYGVLPFSLAHFRRPVSDLDEGSPGESLREANDAVNFDLTELFDFFRWQAKPLGVAEGVRAGWRPPSPVLPGDFIDLPATGVNAAGMGPSPKLGYVAPPLGYAEAKWADIQRFVDATLEAHGIPPQTLRLVMQARSGVSIVAEQAPLLMWAESRQPAFASYEQSLAKVVLAVGAAHLGRFGRDASALARAAAVGRLQLRWPPLYVELPGPQRDQADTTRIALGLATRLDLLMEREGLTREQALARLAQIAADQAAIDRLFPPAVVAPSTGGGDGQGQ